jgi:hypothetical protein
LRSGWLIALITLCSACGSTIIPLYEEQRLQALAAPEPAPDNWSPDCRIAISDRMLQTIASESLKGALQEFTKLDINGPGFSGRPNMTLVHLTLSEGSCEQCLDITASFSGEISWKLLAKSGEAPFKAEARVEAAIEITQNAKGWEVTLRPRQVKRVQLTTETWSGALKAALSLPLELRLKEVALELIPVVPVAKLPANRFPIRAARARSQDGALVVELLASSSSTRPLPPVKLRKGWNVTLSNDALIALARAETFRRGPDSAGVVVTPTGLEARRQAFELEMRIWRLNGSGWWRDYTVSGELAAKSTAVVLTASTVEEVAQSQGAALVDPLAALGESVIVRAIQDAITTSFPNTKSLQIGARGVDLRVTSAHGESGFLVISGVAKVR